MQHKGIAKKDTFCITSEDTYSFLPPSLAALQRRENNVGKGIQKFLPRSPKSGWGRGETELNMGLSSFPLDPHAVSTHYMYTISYSGVFRSRGNFGPLRSQAGTGGEKVEGGGRGQSQQQQQRREKEDSSWSSLAPAAAKVGGGGGGGA